VQVRSKEALEVAQRVLIHGVDLVDAPQFSHAVIAAVRTAADPADQKQIPLIVKTRLAAIGAAIGRRKPESFQKSPVHAVRTASAIAADWHSPLLYPKFARYRKLARQ
jgi:hypothetical protein